MDQNNFDSYDDGDDDCSSERKPHTCTDSYTKLSSPSDNRMRTESYMPLSHQRQEPVYITKLSNGSGTRIRTGSSPDHPTYTYMPLSPQRQEPVYITKHSNGSGTRIELDLLRILPSIPMEAQGHSLARRRSTLPITMRVLTLQKWSGSLH